MPDKKDEKKPKGLTPEEEAALARKHSEDED